jgi:3-deoxy-manno-octulosonate cytidylyltransferase (CMP-KDO synthetase)
MPNIKPNAILRLEKFMRENDCDIGTLASILKNNDDLNNKNVVKVCVDQNLHDKNFLNAKDFFRKKKDLKNDKIYHHIGIYAFTRTALSKYVSLSRSKLEIERNLEQMRAIENNLFIKVALSNSTPLGVDTEEDLKKVEKEMKI